ncbi:MAG: F0F1 ATP synthase subunit delta, partial [Muribaculaceae bacterium]|nr:F0F1 ATP synthase subunit delta [Muribaculaceae bacterium]
MNEGLIPRRYAKALYEVAVERNQAERLYRLMKCLEQQFEASPALEATLANPFVSESDKIALLRTAAGAIDADTAYNDFLKLLAQNRRLDFAPGI